MTMNKKMYKPDDYSLLLELCKVLSEVSSFNYDNKIQLQIS